MIDSNRVGDFPHTTDLQEQEEASDTRETAHQDTGSTVDTKGQAEPALQGLADVFGNADGKEPPNPRVPPEIATQIAQNADPDAQKAMRNAGSSWLRGAVNASVTTVTLKGPDGANGGSSLSQALSAFRAAKEIRLAGDQFTDDNAAELGAFKTAQSVTLDKTTGLTGKVLAGLPRDLQSLKLLSPPPSQINGSSSSQINDEHLGSLSPNLKTFVSSNTGITDAGMKKVPESVKTLGLLNGEVTDAGIKNSPPNLQRLFVQNHKVTDDGIKTLPKNLKQLDLGSSRVTGAAIAHIPKSVHTLGLPFSHLDMDRGLANLSKDVHTLTLSGNAGDVSDNSIAKLPKTVRNLHLVGDVSTERLQQLRNANPDRKITTESTTDYTSKVNLAIRGKGDLALV